ncbi:aminoacyl-histidine dipeptidase [Gemmatimonadetes bacterium T265]|nr:aminoacyl-histidine dipeptidase [Gemmatimonadetes bacterium T265]
MTFAALAPVRARLAAADAAVVADQIAVTEIPAPTGDEGARARWVAARLRAAGIPAVRIDAAGNVVARRPGVDAHGAAPVAVCAHLDTVFPRETATAVHTDGGRLVAPGIGDNGRGLAALLALATVFDGTGLRTRRPIEFVATVGEEGLGDLGGAKHYFAQFPADARPAAAVVLDGPGDERVVHRAVGARRFRLTFRGPGGHSWAAFGTANAVHATARAATRLADVALPPGSAAGRVTLSVGRIGGGLSVNAIPAEGWLEVDLRATTARALDDYEGVVRRAARAAAADENAVRAPGTAALTTSVEVIGDRPAGALAGDHALVQAALAATRLIGRAPQGGAASTDANVPLGLGVPAVAIGAGGRGGMAHTTGEWYENVDGALGIARALTIVCVAAGMAG